MCSFCGEGWRFEATELGGPNAGRVKAVLHPISAKWENLYSQVSDGSMLVSTRDPSQADLWAGSTGIYISQVMPDGSRRARFGGWIPKYNGAGGGDSTIAFQSIEGFLAKRMVAGLNDPYGITVTGSTLTVVKPKLPSGTVPVYGPIATTGTQAAFAAFLVKVAQGNLVGEGFRGLSNLNAVVDPPNAIVYDQSINWWDFKVILSAIEELVKAENGVKYWLEHTFNNGYWSTLMHFSDEIGEDRNYTILSDREAFEYGLEVNAEDKATRVYGLGSGEEENTQFSIAYDADEIDNLPEHQVSVAWKDVTIPETLNALTRGYVTDHRDPVTVPSAALMGLPDYDPDVAGYNPQKGFPGPEILQPGDKFGVGIGYGLITVRDLGVRCLGVSWSLDQGSPATRIIAMQPLIRPNLSIRTQTPARPPAPTQPIGTGGNPVSVTPWPVPGLVVHVDQSQLNEISGMETSRINPGNVAVFNDEVEDYQVRLINLKSGSKYAAFKLEPGLPASQGDPEAIRWSQKSQKQVLADTGDNDNNRPTSGPNQPALYVFTEPKGGGNKTVKTRRLPISFPNNKSINCETLLIHPETDHVFLVSKEGTRARIFSFGTLGSMSTNDNEGTLVATINEKLISDGTHTWDGDRVLFRSAATAKTLVYNSTSWKKEGDGIPTPAMTKSEAIAVESTCSFLTTTEGEDAPIYRVLLDKKYGALCGTVSGSTGTGTGSGSGTTAKVPGQLLNLDAFKLTLPVGSGNKPREVMDLSTFELKPYFWLEDGKNFVTFQAPVNGVTTSGSSYPRSELRQMKNSGDEAAWSNKTQTWEMEATLAFTHLPGGKPHVVGMQVHDSEDDVTVLRLEGNDLYVTRGDDTHFDLIDGSYALGKKIKVKVEARKGDGIRWYLNGVQVARVPGVFSGCYFKAGCYTQANEDNGTGYGQVQIYSLKVTHS